MCIHIGIFGASDGVLLGGHLLRRPAHPRNSHLVRLL